MEGEEGAFFFSATNKCFLADEASRFTVVAGLPDFTGATAEAAAEEEVGGGVAADDGTLGTAAAAGTEFAGLTDKIFPVKGRAMVEAGTASYLF